MRSPRRPVVAAVCRRLRRRNAAVDTAPFCPDPLSSRSCQRRRRFPDCLLAKAALGRLFGRGLSHDLAGRAIGACVHGLAGPVGDIRRHGGHQRRMSCAINRYRMPAAPGAAMPQPLRSDARRTGRDRACKATGPMSIKAIHIRAPLWHGLPYRGMRDER